MTQFQPTRPSTTQKELECFGPQTVPTLRDNHFQLVGLGFRLYEVLDFEKLVSHLEDLVKPKLYKCNLSELDIVVHRRLVLLRQGGVSKGRWTDPTDSSRRPLSVSDVHQFEIRRQRVSL